MEEQGMWVPLGKKMATIKGQTVFSPSQHFSLTVGTSIWTITGKSLRVHFAGSSFFSAYAPPFAPQSPTLYVGPANGDRPAAGERVAKGVMDSRRSYFLGNPTAHVFYKAKEMIPLDHTYLWQNEDELCPKDLFEKLKNDAAGLNLGALMHAGSFVSLLRSKGTMMQMVDFLACGTSFIRGATKNSHGFDTLEAVVEAHIMVEIQPRTRLNILHDGWSTCATDSDPTTPPFNHSGHMNGPRNAETLYASSNANTAGGPSFYVYITLGAVACGVLLAFVGRLLRSKSSSAPTPAE